MKVRAEIEVHEVDGKERKIGDERIVISVQSHWTRRSASDGLVCVTEPGGKTFTVSAQELIKAAERCTGV